MALTRRGILAGLLAGAAAPLWAEEPGIAPARSLLPRRRGDSGATRSEPVTPDSLIAAAKLGAATVGFVLADAQTGQILESRDAGTALPPASVMKAVTAAYALDRLGPDHRFATRILATGPLQGDTLHGDLILAGGGDPVLDTDMLGDLAARLAATGIRRLTGAFLLYDAALPRMERIDAEQPEFVGYNPAISGLNLNFNRVHFEWRRQGGDWNLTMDARAERFVPPVKLARVTVARRETPLFTYQGSPGREDWTVASAALGKGGARWLPVRHPALYVGEVFATLMGAHGLSLPAPSVIDTLPEDRELPRELARHDSDRLDAILRDMLKHSTNLTAEVAGMTASRAASHRASAIATREWAKARHGIAPIIADHSGLGAASRISAAEMVKLLVDVQAGALPGLLKNHGMFDAKGKRVESHPVEVRAKTGTLNFVSTLAGYITPPGGRRMAFAIFAADPERRAALSLAEREDPPGGEGWNKRAKALQGQLIHRWASLHGAA